MKLLTSYFYAVRFMPENYLPISTAVYDPQWFHKFKHPTYKFIDNRGIVNGLRSMFLVPNVTCRGLCNGIDDGKVGDPDYCQFLKTYKKQLDEIWTPEFEVEIDYLLNQASLYVKHEVNQPVFLFHEKPDNPCSERIPFTEWCKENKYDVEEFDWRKYKC